eukprot:XP_001699844.1 predicted protein [Chlamydomonas reinhardtii]
MRERRRRKQQSLSEAIKEDKRLGDMEPKQAALGPGPCRTGRRRQVAAASKPIKPTLMLPQLPSPEVSAQALLRGHDAAVVYVGVLADCASVVSVDMRGQVHIWPYLVVGLGCGLLGFYSLASGALAVAVVSSLGPPPASSSVWFRRLIGWAIPATCAAAAVRQCNRQLHIVLNVDNPGMAGTSAAAAVRQSVIRPAR